MTPELDVEHPDSGPLRDVTDAELAAFDRNGVVALKAIIPASWLDYLRVAVQRIMARHDDSSQNYTPGGQPRFFSQAFPRFIDPAFNAWALRGPTKDIAWQMHPGLRVLRFFYDQVFAQEPGATRGAPYHQDYPYLPIDGDQFLRIWVPLDTVTADNAVRYLIGSHRGPVYRPRSFSGNPDVAAVYANSPYPQAPDFAADHTERDWFIGVAEPGDAVLHHPKTVHGSPANHTSRYRRAVTTIFVGDRVRWDPRSGTSFDHIGAIGAFTVPEMVPDAPVSGPLFPVVIAGPAIQPAPTQPSPSTATPAQKGAPPR